MSLALEDEPLAAWPHGDAPLWELECLDDADLGGVSIGGPCEGSKTGDKVSGRSCTDRLPRRFLPLEGLSILLSTVYGLQGLIVK